MQQSPLHEAFFGSYTEATDAQKAKSGCLHKYLQGSSNLIEGEPNLPFIKLKFEKSLEVLAGTERTMMQWPFTTDYKGDILNSNWEAHTPNSEDARKAWTLFVDYDVIPSGTLWKWDEDTYCRQVAGADSDFSSCNWDKRAVENNPKHHAWPKEEKKMSVVGQIGKIARKEKQTAVCEAPPHPRQNF